MTTAIGICARCRCAFEAGDLRCAVCGLAVPHVALPLERFEARVLRCGTCGAAVRYDIEARSPRCAFCASEMHVEGITDPMEQTERYLPFRVGPEAAKAALDAFLSESRFFRPSDLRSLAVLEALQPTYWVGWCFGGRARVTWTADSDAGNGRSDWAPHSGELDVTFNDVIVSASRGLSEEETLALIPGYSPGGAAPTPQGPEDVTIEQFDVQRSSARARILEAASRSAEAQVRAGDIPGSRYRNVKLSALLQELTTIRYAFPAYILAYRYRGELYRVVVHGQKSELLLGKAPFAYGKAALIVLAVLAAAALLYALV